MADFVEKLTIDENPFIEGMERVTDSIKEAQDQYEQFDDTVTKANKDISKNAVDGQKKVSTAIKETTTEQRKQSQATLESAKNYKFFGVSLNDITGELNKWKNDLIGANSIVKQSIGLSRTQQEGVVTLSNALGGGRGAFVAMAKGANILKVAIASTGIGLLIVGLASLASFLTTSQKGMDFLAQKTSYLSGAFDVAKDRANKFGESILTSFQNGTVIQDFGQLLYDQVINRFTGAYDVVKNFFSLFSSKSIAELKDKLGDVSSSIGQVVTGVKSADLEAFAADVDSVAKANENITKSLQALKREQASYQVEFAKTRAQIEQLKKVGDDITKPISQRIDAVKKGAALEQNINAKNLEFIGRELSLVKQKNALTGSTDADRQKQYDLELQYAEALNDSVGKQTELQNTLNGLIKESADKYKEIQKSIFEQSKSFGLLTNEQERSALYEEQAKLLNEQLKELEDIAKVTKSDVSKEIEGINKLLIAAGIEARKIEPFELIGKNEDSRITALKKRIEDLKDISFKFNVDTTQDQNKIEEQIKKVLTQGIGSKGVPEVTIPLDVTYRPVNTDSDSFIDFLDDINTFEDLFNEAINGIFGDKNAEAKAFFSGLSSFVNEFGSLLNEATDLQLASIDKQLEAVSKRREELQDELSQELEDQKEGLANNVGEKQANVDALLLEEERLNKEREKIQKDAQRRQIIADSIQQGQSLITSSINIIKGFSNIPVIGLPLGIAAVATLLGFFAKTKADAIKQTRLFTGAKRINDHFGFADRHGDTDIPGMGDGYLLVNQRTGKPTNTVISGREMLIPENISMTHEQFLHNLRLGMYNNIDLNKVVGAHLNFKDSNRNSTQIGSTTIVNNTTVKQQPIRQYIPITKKDGKQVFYLATISPDAKDGSIIEIDM